MTSKTVLLLVLVAALVAGGLAPLATPAGGHVGIALPAPRAMAAPALALPPAAAPHPAQSVCQDNPTPSGSPDWNSPNFFSDALVTFSVPGSSGLSGSSFQTVPCDNVIPTYTNGFWMNVTTNVVLLAANVTIWGTGWPTPGQAAPDIPNFGPGAPTRVLPMFINPPYYHTASFFFNVYRFFWPGSQVYFNITLAGIGATPAVVRSSNAIFNPIPFPGGINNATWEFYVSDPWGNGQLQSDDASFSQVIQVTTTPEVLTTPGFDPNPKQALDVTLTSVNPTGGPANPIPEALAYFSLSGGSIGTAQFEVAFGPANHTTVHLDLPVGPYPGSHVTFNVSAWLPWAESSNGQVGAIDRIYSPYYSFNWTNQGGWWYPTYGLLGNLQLTSLPDVTSVGGTTASLATGTGVNVTVHSPIQNVTIGSASIAYRYTDANGAASGTLPMRAATANTSYVLIPGLPPGASLTFSVTAKDVFGNPVSSGNYTYTESGAPSTPLAGSYGLFFAEGVDLATGHLIPFINFTISNSTWSEKGVGTSLGFLYPIPLTGVGYLAVAYGAYTVVLSAFGASQTFTFTVSTATPFTVLFYFTSAPLTPQATVDLTTTVTLPAIVGIVAAALVTIPVVRWFRERRRKAEAEQRRISL